MRSYEKAAGRLKTALAQRSRRFALASLAFALLAAVLQPPLWRPSYDSKNILAGTIWLRFATLVVAAVALVASRQVKPVYGDNGAFKFTLAATAFAVLSLLSWAPEADCDYGCLEAIKGGSVRMMVFAACSCATVSAYSRPSG